MLGSDAKERERAAEGACLILQAGLAGQVELPRSPLPAPRSR